MFVPRTADFGAPPEACVSAPPSAVPDTYWLRSQCAWKCSSGRQLKTRPHSMSEEIFLLPKQMFVDMKDANKVKN